MSEKLSTKVTRMYEYAVRWFERILALLIFAALVLFLVSFAPVFVSADWADVELFQEMIHIILTVIIGLEAVRLLTTHSMDSVLELLSFVVARKALEPNAGSVDLILMVVAFTILISARYILSCIIPKYAHKKELPDV